MLVVAHIAIMVGDLDVMVCFYQEAFSMWVHWKNDEKAYLTTGHYDILALLREDGHPSKSFDLAKITADPQQTPNFPHFGAVVDSEEESQRILEWAKARELTVVGPKISRDTTRSFYFPDPEGNTVQVVLPPPEYFVPPPPAA